MVNPLDHGRTLLLPGVELWDFADTVAVVSHAQPLRAAAAAPLGAGVGWRRTLLVHQFAPHYRGAAPAADLGNVADRLQLPEPRAGFPACWALAVTHLVVGGPPATALVAVGGRGDPPGVLAVVGGSLTDADLVNLLLVVWTAVAAGPPPLMPAGVVVAARRGGRQGGRPAAGALVAAVQALLARPPTGTPGVLTRGGGSAIVLDRRV